MPRNWVWCGLATVLVAAPMGPALANLAICAKLVDEGRIYDQGGQIDAKTLVQGAICGGAPLSFAAAISAEETLEIPILTTLNARFGDATDLGNFQERHAAFCADGADDVGPLADALSEAFEPCVERLTEQQPGLYGYVQSGEVFERFSIELHVAAEGESQPWTIEEVEVSPRDGASCEIELPEEISDNARSIACRRLTTQPITVAVATSQGEMPETTLPAPAATEDVLLRRIAELQSRLDEVARGSRASAVPSGTIAAFELDECPRGWAYYEPAASRVVVGEGQAANLAKRSLGETDGSERIKLVREHLPEVALRLPTRAYNDNSQQGGEDFITEPNPYGVQASGRGNFSEHERLTEFLGKGQPIDYMPPFVVLRYCVKQ